MKNYLKIMLLLLLAVPGNGHAATMRGDINGDNLVDVNDVTLLINVALGKNSALMSADYDLNFDGEVDVTDVTLLIGYVLGTRELPPVPPVPGEPLEVTVRGVDFTMMPVDGGTFTMVQRPSRAVTPATENCLFMRSLCLTTTSLRPRSHRHCGKPSWAIIPVTSGRRNCLSRMSRGMIANNLSTPSTS